MTPLSKDILSYIVPYIPSLSSANLLVVPRLVPGQLLVRFVASRAVRFQERSLTSGPIS